MRTPRGGPWSHGCVEVRCHHDWLKALLDCCSDLVELEMKQDKIDKIDHEAMYSDAEDDPSADMPEEESDSVNTSVYDQVGATLASTVISTDTEAASDMLNLTMGQPELPAPQEAHDLAVILIMMITHWQTCLRLPLRSWFPDPSSSEGPV